MVRIWVSGFPDASTYERMWLQVLNTKILVPRTLIFGYLDPVSYFYKKPYDVVYAHNKFRGKGQRD